MFIPAEVSVLPPFVCLCKILLCKSQFHYTEKRADCKRNKAFGGLFFCFFDAGLAAADRVGFGQHAEPLLP